MNNVSNSKSVTIFKTPTGWCLEVAFLVLFVAKVFGYTNLSWWTVTSPLWLPIAICFGVFLSFYLGWLIIAGILLTFATIATGIHWLYTQIIKIFTKNNR